MKNRKTYLSLILMMISFSFIYYSCNKDDGESAPVIPPSTTLAIEFPYLPTTKKAGIEVSNWQFSTVSLALWNTFLNKNCIIPITSFKEANEQKPSYIDNNTWEWKTSFDGDSITIKATLHGKIENDSVKWNLYISTAQKTNASDEFLWIEGVSAKNQSGGWWLIYEKPSNPVPYIKISWTRENEKPTTVIYTLVKTDDPDAGNVLESGTLNHPLYNTYYSLKLQHGKTIFIELNKESKAGHIKSELLFNDTQWHCWNSLFENEICQ